MMGELRSLLGSMGDPSGDVIPSWGFEKPRALIRRGDGGAAGREGDS